MPYTKSWTARALNVLRAMKGTLYEKIQAELALVQAEFTSIQTAMGKADKVIVTIPMSFETGEQTTTKIYFNDKITVNKIRSIVMKALAATDVGTITASNSVGAMANGVITHAISEALNTEQSASPTTNNVIAADSYVQLVSAKTTAGGKVLVTIEATRTN